MFQKISETRSINRAAQELNISQPALSRHMTRLEEDLGVKLMLRTHSGVELTRPGHTLYEHTGALLNRLDSIRREVAGSAAAANDEVSIGVTPAVSNLLMGRFVARLGARYPELRLKVSEGTSDKLLRWVVSRDISFGIVLEPNLPSGLSHVPLWEENLFLVGRADNMIFRRPAVTIRDLSGLPFCLTGPSIGARRWIAESFRQAGAELIVRHEMESVSSLTALLSGTGTFSIMSYPAVENILSAGPVAGIQINDLTVGRDLVWRSDLELSRDGKHLGVVLRDAICSDLEQSAWLQPAKR